MASIRKAVIPVAGFGTRMLPVAKAVPKELLPILDRPTIHYVVEEAVNADINDVLLVTSREKRAIEDYFDRNPDLAARLQKSGRSSLLAPIDALMERVTIQAIRQREAKGLGDAVAHAENFVGADVFLCSLGDTIFGPDFSPARQLRKAYERFGTPIIGVEEVAADRVDRYGIIGFEPIDADHVRVTSLVEKPRPDAAPSRLAIAGRYILTPTIFESLRKTAPGVGGEVQLTDALNLMLKTEKIHATILKTKRHDIGNVVDWLETNLVFATRDEKVWAALRPTIEKLLRRS